MSVSEIGKLRQLEDENYKVKKLVAELSLDMGSKGDHKKVLQPEVKKKMVIHLIMFRVINTKIMQIVINIQINFFI